MGEIAREVDLTTGTLTRLIDQIEAAGLVRREADRVDRRVIVVSLTEAGQKAHDRAMERLGAFWAGALECMPEDEQAMLTRSLERLAELIHAQCARERDATRL